MMYYALLTELPIESTDYQCGKKWFVDKLISDV